MRTSILCVLLLMVVAVPAWAQDPGMRRQRLRQQVVQRFMQNYRTQAGLSDEQFGRVEEIMRRSFQANAELQRRERELWMALERQMRPGVAAEADSVSGLLDALIEVQGERVERFRADQAEYSEFLTSVQRAQLAMAWRRLQNQIQRVRDAPPDRRRIP